MNKMFKSEKIIYIFYFLAILILSGSIYIYNEFENTGQDIKNLNLESNLEYIDKITSNMATLINNSTPEGIFKNLKDDTKLREELEKSLQILITKKYRYVYVVDKSENNKNFRFLLDGAKNTEDKSDFLESYVPINVKYWKEVYRTKKAVYYKDKHLKSLWLTYLKPILRDGKVEAIIAIDFSLKEQNLIASSLKKLIQTFILIALFSFAIFVIIIFFSYIDRKRISVLQLQTKEIQSFNKTLQEKVDSEVQKNREKDKAILQQSRLAQMGEMISMIAHQWRQPLTAISATSGNLTLKAKLDKLDNNTAVELGEKISGYSQHLSSTIDDFRDFFKPNKQIIDTTYTELVQSVLSIVADTLNTKNIKLKQDLQSETILSTYPNELKQVILNLIKNAEDILLEKEIENPVITIETQDNILRVKDNAGGVPPNIIEKIFDPYFSTKTKKDGTGLGLYMSKTIIQEHCGGELSVYNDKNGAVFEMKLPIN